MEIAENSIRKFNSLVGGENAKRTVLKKGAAVLFLTQREEQIIRMRFEIGYETAYILDEIGRKFGVTRERIRQIESEALKKLAKSEEREGVLKSFLE
jgi:DNA-directed RNA polymerase sigma subunit (sigma70/sigma32)